MTKYETVRDSITEAIRSGEFPSGEQLPAERDLAARFGVSYMTARRAVNELVEAELIERKSRNKTYVRTGSRGKLHAKTLNLLWLPHGNPGIESHLQLTLKYVEQRGWDARVIRLQKGSNDAALRALKGADMTLAWLPPSMLNGPLGEAMQSAGGHAVLLGNRMDHLGVPSVLADDAQAMRLAIDYLRSFGHQDIALLIDHHNEPNSHVRLATWRACFAEKDTCKRLISVETPDFECPTRFAYEATCKYLRVEKDVSALICLSDQMTLGAIAACHDVGRPVPDTMSLINSGDSSLMQFARPPVTVVDVCFEQHITAALAMLEAAVEGHLAPQNILHLVQPRLIERETVRAPVKHSSSNSKLAPAGAQRSATRG